MPFVTSERISFLTRLAFMSNLLQNLSWKSFCFARGTKVCPRIKPGVLVWMLLMWSCWHKVTTMICCSRIGASKNTNNTAINDYKPENQKLQWLWTTTSMEGHTYCLTWRLGRVRVCLCVHPSADICGAHWYTWDVQTRQPEAAHCRIPWLDINPSVCHSKTQWRSHYCG